MNKFSLKYLFVMLLWCNLFVVVGQNRNTRFQHLTIEDGLPQNMVDCMLQDSQGFLWFGTWNGICRYDGYNFEVFDGQGSINALDNNFIYSLLEDPFGNLWIGTRQELSTYVYDLGRFIPINEAFGLHEIRSLEMFQDSILVIGSDTGLTFLTILNSRGEVSFEKHIEFGESLNGSVVNSVLSDSWDNLWVGTNGGMTMFPADGSKPIHHVNDPLDPTSISTNQVLDIIETQNKDIWVGTEFGLNKYNVDGTFDRFYNYPSDPSSLVHNTVMDLEENSGELLIATLGGLSVMDIKSETIRNHLHESNVPHSLSNDFVNCLLKDDAGNIWIGTERGGVNYYNTSQNQIEHYEQKMDDPNSLSVSTINSIYEDDQFLWIGTAGGGLNRYDKSTGNFKHYIHDPEITGSISSDFITGIRRDRSGKLWVSTWGSGLNILNQSSQTFSQISEGLVSGFISSMEEDKHGNLWIGTLGGISRYDQDTQAFMEVFSGNTETKITNVGCLLFDAENSLWVGSRHGLYHLQSKDGHFEEINVTRFTYSQEKAGSISGNYIISIEQDSDGALWVGTYGQGLNRMHHQGDSIWFESFTTADGLSNTVIYGILEDKNKDLWLSTDYGLSRFNPATGYVRNFYQIDGLLNNQYYWSASYKNQDGKLYFGGMNGLDAFYPDWIQEDLRSRDVVITEIKLLNESVRPGLEYNDVVVLNRSPNKASRIELSYKEKAFSVEFSSLNYQESEMIRYAYILEGFEKNWNYVSSTRRYAGYTNLKPGNYTFKVKASGSNGEFTGETNELEIYIAPPFWDTPWFRGLSLMALIALVFGYVRYRTYSLKRQKMILEDQVQERTERINQQNEALSFQAVQLKKNNNDLEDKQKLIAGQNLKLENQNKEILSQRDELIALNEKLKLVSQLKLSFFTNISHEFRTPLTLIIGPIERLLKENDFNEEVMNTLKMMSRNAQRLLHLINQIMDFRKIEKGRMELNVTQTNISEFCKNVFSAFEPLSEIKDIRFTYDEHDLPAQVWFDAQKLENILYNLLSNAFKYTRNGGTVSVEVSGLSPKESRLSPDEEFPANTKTVLSIKVSDTGMGISQENLPLVFKRFYRIESEEAFKISGSGIGLALTEELIKTHHGEIFVDSKLGEGSTFEVQFPCLKGAYTSDEVNGKDSEALNIHDQVAILKNEFLIPELTEDGTESEMSQLDQTRSTLLVVEDNNDLRRFMVHRLRKSYNVIEAPDGLQGIAMAEKESPDAIISDVMMPNVDGLELCGTLKNNLSTSHIPIILLTAKSAIENQIEGLQIGADDYLAKPFNFELLEARVQNLIESRAKLRQLFQDTEEVSPNEVTTNIKDQKFLEHAIQTVEENLTDSDFGARQFVESMGISRSLLHKKLTSITNQSAAEFINHLRMKKAKELLRQNELNVSEVAYAVGYNDPKYFTRLFSKLNDQSPKEFANSFLVRG